MARADLRRVERARAKLEASRQELREAILAAYESGETTRDIGQAAGISHQRVSQIVREMEG